MELDLKNLTPDVRKLDDMRNVLCDRGFAESAEDFELYYMYRKTKQENGLVRNITVITPKMLGNEFMKTKGHVHIGDFKEIYTVISGRAIFFMQKGDENKIEDVYAVEAGAGESAIIPSGYGHVTINPSETEELKTGDWTSEKSRSDYSLFEKLQGACYYYINEGGAKWIKNENYKLVPELRFEESLKSAPEDLSFLKQG